MGRLVLLVAVILVSSAAMSNGIRTAGTVVGDGGAPAPCPAVVTTQTAVEVATPPVATAAAAAKVSSDQQAPLDDDPYKHSKRKVPNGQDPIHNRRARWGDALAKRVYH